MVLHDAGVSVVEVDGKNRTGNARRNYFSDGRHQVDLPTLTIMRTSFITEHSSSVQSFA